VDVTQWVEELGAVLAAPDLPRLQRNEPGLDKKWKAGDIAATIPPHRLEAVAEKVGITTGLLKSYRDVAMAFPPEERSVKAAWTVYREVRHVERPARDEILRDGLTLRAARLAVGKGPMDQPKRERQSIEERAWAVVAELQEPRVRELVMREMEGSAADRKARKAAKTTMDEISARKKFIETELRKERNKPTPYFQFLKASKQLAEAQTFVYSVGQLHEQHEDVMEEERWQEIAQTLRDLATAAADVADRVAGIDYGDYIDGEEVYDGFELGPGSSDIVDAEIVDED
jgi:hypothetical protein